MKCDDCQLELCLELQEACLQHHMPSFVLKKCLLIHQEPKTDNNLKVYHLEWKSNSPIPKETKDNRLEASPAGTSGKIALQS